MKKRIILVAAAVLLAVVGTFAVYSYGKGADSRALKSTKSATALVVTKRIPAGTTWTDVMSGNYFGPQNFPAESVPSSALTTTVDSGINNSEVALADVTPGQFVLREAFGTKTPQTGALTIPKGMVAVSVALPINAEVAGYVGPDAEVSIFVTSKLTSDAKKTQDTAGDELDITRLVIPRASVLAVSQAPVKDVEGGGSDSSSSGSPIVTLALTQLDAQRVILSQHVGELYLALLSPSSVVSAADPGVNNLAKLNPIPVFVK
jgi:pilus assembly protein CpaB